MRKICLLILCIKYVYDLVISSGEALSIREGVKMPTQGICKRCNYISSQDLCKACVLLEGLNKGLPKLGIGKSSKVKDALAVINNEQQENTTKKEGCCGGGSCQKGSGISSSTSASCGKNIKQSKRQSKKSLAKAKIASSANAAPPDLKEVFNARDAGDVNDDEFDMFGCGGGTDMLQSLNMNDDDDDEEGSNRMEGSDLGDIENLGHNLKKMLHLGNSQKNSLL